MSQYVVVDCATGGNNSEDHSLLAISAIHVTSSFETMERIDLRILHDTFHVTFEALQKNHVNLMDPTGFVPHRDAKRAFFRFMGFRGDEIEKLLAGVIAGRPARLIPTGINITYDIPFLKKFFGEDVYKHLFAWRPFDVMSSYETLYTQGVVKEPKSMSILGIAESLGLEVDADKVHEPKYATALTCMIARIIHKKSEVVAKIIAEHGSKYALFDETVATTKVRALQRSRKVIKKVLEEDDEDLSEQ